jgi:uroporphyrinogen III methyltransferase / synthase
MNQSADPSHSPSSSSIARVARVVLVGAGPGEPGWITVRGLECIRAADVLVYDALANPALLEEAPPHAQKIDAGKRAKEHKLTQDQTNQLLADLALSGKFVVRLKGGDPYLFGRGAEEVEFLAARGVDCEVVPGITSGIAGPMAAGIPVTHRDYASTLTFVTGHEDPTKGVSNIDYPALARMIQVGGTACLYMGVGRIGAISATLISHNLPAETPVAVVQWGSTTRQRSIRTTLGKAEADIAAAGLGPPAMVVIGRVAAIDAPGLDFFTRHRPLLGQRILVTRTRQQASELKAKLAALGADVLEAPTIQIQAPDSWDEVDQTILETKKFAWVVFTSANGVTAFAERLFALKLDARHLSGIKFACVGQQTADTCRALLSVTPDLVPTRQIAESLAGDLIAKEDIKGRDILLFRADIARPGLPLQLAKAGAHVHEVVAYETKPADNLPEDVLKALREKTLHWVTFTSASTAANLVTLLGSEKDLLTHVKVASIGPITSEEIRKLGFTIHLESQEASVQGLVNALAKALSL